MSIHLTVGFQTTNYSIEDAEFTQFIHDRLAGINQFLRALSLPPHHEPVLPATGTLALTITSAMFPLRDFAHQVAQETSWEFPHLLEVGVNWGFYLPRQQTAVWYPPTHTQTGPIGSSYQLLWECLLLSRLLGIEADICQPDEIPISVATTLPTVSAKADDMFLPMSGCEKMVQAALHSIHTQAILIIS